MNQEAQTYVFSNLIEASMHRNLGENVKCEPAKPSGNRNASGTVRQMSFDDSAERGREFGHRFKGMADKVRAKQPNS